MKKAAIVVHHHYIEDVIRRLHETGLMQIIHIGKEEPKVLDQLDTASMHPEADTCATYELRLTRLIDILKKMQKKPSGIKALLNPQHPERIAIQPKSLHDLYTDIDKTLADIEETILQHHEHLQQLNEQETAHKDTLQKLDYLKTFDYPLELLGESPHLITKTGVTQDLEALKQATDTEELIDIYTHQFGSGKKTHWAVLIIGHISTKDTFDKICRQYISELSLPELTGTPKQVTNDLQKKQENIQKEKKQLKKKLQAFTEQQLTQLLAFREQIQHARIRKEIPQHFGKTHDTYLIKGWVLARDSDTLQQDLIQQTDDHVDIHFDTPSMNPDNPPTYIKTPWWAKGFKDLLEMFALPKYNELDPTVIMGVFFVLFFGFMLGDAGYGMIILLGSLFGYLKLGKHSAFIKNWSFMGIWMGVTATVVGVLTYSIFGNLIHLFVYNNPAEPIYQFILFGQLFPVDSLDQPLAILTAALILGLVQLNVGVTLGIIQAFRRKEYKQLLTERLCWIPLQIGGGLLIGYFILGWSLSQPMFYIAGALVVIGLIQLVIAAGPIGFFSITGYVGDWLSYARLLALGLATAGMALAFNIVSQLLGEMIPVIGIAITVILLFIMHIVNLALSTLGAAVHSLRLQYVEFFNRFYEGGGRAFSPFKLSRKYTKIKEE